MRLIDADEIRIKPDFIFYGVCGTPVIRCEDLARIINDMPTIEPQKWVSCSERLPELYKPVLVTGGDIIWICELIESPDLDDGEFQWEDKMLGHWYSFDNWDAWCPLPEPWKEEEE